MEFLVESEVEVPAGAPDEQVEQHQRAKSAAAAKPPEDGHLVRLGTLLPGSSADWQIVLPDGTALGDIRYTLQADHGNLLYVQLRGVRHGSAEYTFRTSTQIETAAPRLERLNRGVFASVGARQPSAVIHEAYLVA
jgi:hypothetical protein